MKIACLTNRYPWMSHTFIRREIAGLEAAGVEVVRLSIRRPEQDLVDARDRRELGQTRWLLRGGVPVLVAAGLRQAVRRPVPLLRAVARAARLGWRSDRGLLRHAAYLGEACRLRGWLAREPVDHVHVHFGTNPAAVALLTRTLGGPPYSFTAHGPEEFRAPARLKIAAKAADASFVVAISEFAAERLRGIAGRDARVHVVRCGLAGDELALPRVPLPAERRLAFVGRLCPEKRPTLLIELFARVAADFDDAELIIIGDGPLRPDVEETMRRTGVAGRVRLHGWGTAEDVRDAIRRSRALVLPSREEGLPSVLMEAMAQERPVIATAVAGIPELVRSGDTGWLLDPDDPGGFEQAMRDALRLEPGALAAMGRRGRDLVLEQHDAAKEARRLLDLIARPRTA
ncbi:MAG: glycosyltransferase family 4 protein [Planctomycetota bacterium]|jgi:glycosyltransferase involved in cell wall biosynthesis